MFVSSFLSNKTLQERGEDHIGRGLDINSSSWMCTMLWVEADTAFVLYYGLHPEERNILMYCSCVNAQIDYLN